MSTSGFNLKDILHVAGTGFITISTLTDQKIPGGKKNPFQGKVTKRTDDINCMVFSNTNVNAYQNMIQRKQVKEGMEGDYQVKPRVWGVRIAGTPFIEHKGAFYLEVIVRHSGNKQYFVEGRPVDVETIKEDGYTFKYLVENGERLTELQAKSKTKPESQGGIEDKIDIRTYKIDSLAQLKHNGAVFNKLFYAP